MHYHNVVKILAKVVASFNLHFLKMQFKTEMQIASIQQSSNMQDTSNKDQWATELTKPSGGFNPPWNLPLGWI